MWHGVLGFNNRTESIVGRGVWSECRSFASVTFEHITNNPFSHYVSLYVKIGIKTDKNTPLHIHITIILVYIYILSNLIYIRISLIISTHAVYRLWHVFYPACYRCWRASIHAVLRVSKTVA